jgi:hypothetical protein
MPLKTPFSLLIRFIYNFTGRNYNHILHCYTFTQHTILHANIPFYSELLVFTWKLLTTNCLVAPVVFKVTPLHGPHGKRSLYCWDVIQQFPSNSRGSDLQKTCHVIGILLAYWRADCCLATSNNIRNSIVACVYWVARCLPVRCLAIHITLLWSSSSSSSSPLSS